MKPMDQPEYDGPERVINYLSNYVQGNVITLDRIIEVSRRR